MRHPLHTIGKNEMIPAEFRLIEEKKSHQIANELPSGQMGYTK
jgi:hypothetical protein